MSGAESGGPAWVPGAAEALTPDEGAAARDSLEPLETAKRLAAAFEKNAVERDARGGTPKAERDLIRASGLLKLGIPARLGGQDQPWPGRYRVVRTVSAADASLGQVLGFHYVLLATCALFGARVQSERLLAESAANNWFWGNALNPLDSRLALIRRDGRALLRGRKSYATGALDSDRLVVSALEQESGKLVVAVLPTGRPGISLAEDWACMGQRQTDSGSALFEDVALGDDEILGPPGPMGSPFAGLRPCVAQLTFVNVYLGLAQGALAAAGRFTREKTRTWPWSGVPAASEDPYVLGHFGALWAQVEGAVAAADRAADLLQEAWEQGEALDPAQRGRVALAVATAKVLSSRAALEAGSRVFEATGPGAAASAEGLDRYWRNARVLTLHDRLDYKLRELGDWALNGRLPEPSLYS